MPFDFRKHNTRLVSYLMAGGGTEDKKKKRKKKEGGSLYIGGPQGAARQHRRWDTGKSVHQEKKGCHVDGHTDQDFQWGQHVPHAVRGGDLVVLLIYMFLVPWSIVHIQIIRQLCQKRRRIWIAGLHTLSGLHHSQPSSPVWTGEKFPPGFFFGSKGGKEKVLLGGCGLQRDSQTCPSADSGSNEWVSQPFPLCFGSTNTAGCLLALCNIPQADLYPWIEGHFHHNLHQRVLCGGTYLSLCAGEGRGERLRMECSFS